MAMLSPFIHLLQQRSFRRSGTETCAGRSATPRKLSSLAAHLFDARRTLPPHSCQVPQCWAVGRTNGMKRSFFGAVAAARGRTEHSNDDFSGFGEAQCDPWISQQSGDRPSVQLGPAPMHAPLSLRALATRCGRAPYFPRRREIRMGISVWPYLEPLSRLESAHLGTRCRAADEHCARAPRLPTPL